MKKYIDDIQHISDVVEKVVTLHIDLTEPYEHFMNICFSFASLGEEGRELCHRVCAINPKYTREEVNEKFDNCLRLGRGDISIGTFMQYAKDAGIDISKPRGRKKMSEEEKSNSRAEKIQQAISHLHQGYDFRHNQRLHRLEYRKKGDEEFIPMDDTMSNTLYIDLVENGITLGPGLYKILLGSNQFAPYVDPIKDWLDSLAPWDPTLPDYLAEFWGHLIVRDPENWDFYLKYMKKWHVAWVGMMRGIIDKYDLMIVLKGLQGKGKTWFCQHLLPESLYETYTFAPSPNAPIDKDFTLSLTEKVLTFLDEIDMKSEHKSNAFKYIISMKNTTVRDSYHQFRQDVTKHCALIATCNDEEYLIKQEGRRRYLSVPVLSTKPFDELPWQGAFAQALYLLNDSDFSPFMTSEDNEELTLHNDDSTISDPLEEAIRTCFRLPKEGEQPEYITTADIIRELDISGYRSIKMPPCNIGKVVAAMGCVPLKTKHGKKYTLVVIPAEERTRLRKTGEVTVEAEVPNSPTQSLKEDTQLELPV